jgi:hypothetical protein
MLIAGNVANGSLPPVSLKNKAGDRRDAAKNVSGNVIIVLITILSRLRIINIDWWCFRKFGPISGLGRKYERDQGWLNIACVSVRRNRGSSQGEVRAC